jgi:hypothetical protein
LEENKNPILCSHSNSKYKRGENGSMTISPKIKTGAINLSLPSRRCSSISHRSMISEIGLCLLRSNLSYVVERLIKIKDINKSGVRRFTPIYLPFN